MKHLKIFSVFALSVFAVGCSDKPSGDAATASYYLGFQMGDNLRKQNLNVDQKEVVHGLRDGLNGKTAALNQAEMSTAQQAFSKMAADKHREMQEANAKAAAKFLEGNKKNADWKVLPSGLQYKVIAEGSGKPATEAQTITVHYTGTLTDGTKFDSSRDRTAPADYKLGGVIKGMREALSIMKPGAHYVVAMPPELAYGPSGNGPIPPNAVLIYDIEVLKIK